MNIGVQKQRIWTKGLLKTRVALTKPESTKNTFHLVLEFPEEQSYLPGDSIAILPKNPHYLVERLCDKLPFAKNAQVENKKTGEKLSFYTFLQEQANLQKVSKKLQEAFGAEPKPGFTQDLLALVTCYPDCKIPLQSFVDLLLPMIPRFYSIASSPTVHPKQVHLTVSLASYTIEEQLRYGACSYFLCKELQEKETISTYIHSALHFRLPEDSSKNIIMIGPGTGVAPFRGFMQERIANFASGKHWLFFGERQRNFDFYYENEWKCWENAQQLRLDTAFSRDQNSRIYVQNLLLEHQKALYDWIEKGAYLYICGDAKKMAKDVQKTWEQIFQNIGNLSLQSAQHYWKKLKKERRIQLDIY